LPNVVIKFYKVFLEVYCYLVLAHSIIPNTTCKNNQGSLQHWGYFLNLCTILLLIQLNETHPQIPSLTSLHYYALIIVIHCYFHSYRLNCRTLLTLHFNTFSMITTYKYTHTPNMSNPYIIASQELHLNLKRVLVRQLPFIFLYCEQLTNNNIQ
jgi:hypothetical protein